MVQVAMWQLKLCTTCFLLRKYSEQLNYSFRNNHNDKIQLFRAPECSILTWLPISKNWVVLLYRLNPDILASVVYVYLSLPLLLDWQTIVTLWFKKAPHHRAQNPVCLIRFALRRSCWHLWHVGVAMKRHLLLRYVSKSCLSFIFIFLPAQLGKPKTLALLVAVILFCGPLLVCFSKLYHAISILLAYLFSTASHLTQLGNG